MEDFYQYSVFDLFSEPLKIDKPIRLIELFAGIGSQAKALERIGADFEHYRVCEFDKYAIKSYNAIHGTSFETSDITQITADDLGIVDTDKYCYMVTYSFPCQDLSLAGKQKGMAKGENTRSGLLWEVERLLNECEELPQVLLMENVTQVHGKKNMEHFQAWIDFLESKGYSNYWKDLNAKNFGIPQNRNRTFMVSVLGNYTYEFPKEIPLKLRLKDMLEDSVDEKFYLSGKMVDYLHNITEKNISRGNGNIYTPSDVDGCSKCITTKEGQRVKDNFIEEPKCKQVGILSGGKWDKLHDISRRVYSGDGVSPTIHTCGGGNLEPKVVEPAIQKVDVPQTVRVRKYTVDCKSLCKLLRERKQSLQLSTQDIADRLKNVPLTTVEHWFRQDNSFAIPDENIWFKLKSLLCIETNEFDEAITVFEEKEGVFEKSNRCYLPDGLAPTITSASADEKIIEPAINVVGNYSPSGHDASRIVDTDGLAPTVKENHGTVTAIAEPKIIDDFYKNRDERVYEDVSPTLRADRVGLKVAEPFIVASRGRNPDNPSDRTPGIPLEQRLEPNFSGCSNTLTTVQKDNYVAEPLAYDEQNGYIRKDGTVGTLTTDGSSPKHNNRVVEPIIWDGYNQRIRAEKGSVGTLTTNCGADLKRNGQGVVEGCRIRKLTPKECWRLMGFDDADFEKAAQHNSNSQLYKQAGNSIVVDVLVHIFTQMF
jgi:DNA (cytosine-5)-methyltransferase 1